MPIRIIIIIIILIKNNMSSHAMSDETFIACMEWVLLTTDDVPPVP